MLTWFQSTTHSNERDLECLSVAVIWEERIRISDRDWPFLVNRENNGSRLCLSWYSIQMQNALMGLNRIFSGTPVATLVLATK